MLWVSFYFSGPANDFDTRPRPTQGQYGPKVCVFQSDAPLGRTTVGRNDMKENRAPGPRNHRRIVMSDDRDHIVQAVPSPHLFVTGWIRKVNLTIISWIVRIVAPAHRWVQRDNGKTGRGWVDSIRSVKDPPERESAQRGRPIPFPFRRYDAGSSQTAGSAQLTRRQRPP